MGHPADSTATSEVRYSQAPTRGLYSPTGHFFKVLQLLDWDKFLSSSILCYTASEDDQYLTEF